MKLLSQVILLSMNAPPRFSVIIPTRDRASYLPTAIQSVLDQSYDDIELIVSDNASTDNTAEIARGFDDPRIKYVKTREPLTINRSWEFGVEQASGEYIAFLADDDVFSKIYLQTFADEIDDKDPDVVACGLPQYYEVTHHEAHHKFTWRRFTGKSRLYNCEDKSSDVLRYMFARAELADYPDQFAPVDIPYGANGVYRRSIFDGLRSMLGSVFPYDLASFDVYNTAVMLSHFTRRYCYVDQPLYIQRVSDASLTRSPDIERQKQTYGRPTHDVGIYQDLFLDFAYNNLWIEACLLAVKDTGMTMDFELSWPRYYIKAFNSLKYLESHGFNMTKEKTNFWKQLGNQDQALQDEVLSVIRTPRMRLSDLVRSTKIGGALLRARDAYRQDEEDVGGLDEPLSIGEYANIIDEKFVKHYSSLL